MFVLTGLEFVLTGSDFCGADRFIGAIEPLKNLILNENLKPKKTRCD